MKRIANFIEHQECPIVNGIMFSDETIELMHIEVNWNKPITYEVKRGSRLRLKEDDESENLGWTSCAILCELIDNGNNAQIICGEAGFGGDGFVAVIDLASKKTRWLAFFDCSNPFDSLNIKGQELFASSTLGCVWKFNVQNPVDILVQCQ